MTFSASILFSSVLGLPCSLISSMELSLLSSQWGSFFVVGNLSDKHKMRWEERVRRSLESEFHLRMWAHFCNLDLHIHLMNSVWKFGSQSYFLKEVECQEGSSWGGGTEGWRVGETNWSCHITQIRLCLPRLKKGREISSFVYTKKIQSSAS